MTSHPSRNAFIEADAEGGELSTGPLEKPLARWDHVFERFGLDPQQYEIVGDTVRQSAWESGDRTLYSYRASFRRVLSVEEGGVSPRQVEYWKRRLHEPRAAVDVSGLDSAYVIVVSDGQLGKRGTGEAVENWRRGIERHLDVIDGLGHVEEIVLAFNGDEIENIAGNYANQLHTVELNLTRQIELAFELEMWSIQQLASMGVPLHVTSVISNHAELGRLGQSKNQTSQSDNASTMITRMCKRVFDEAGRQDIRWTIAGGEPHVTADVGGIPCYMSHGHIAKGPGQSAEQRVKNSLQKQILGRRELYDTRLFFVSHYHHAYYQEFEGRTLFGSPALEAEGASAYMRDTFGVWSPPGMLGVEVGTRHGKRGWGAQRVL